MGAEDVAEPTLSYKVARGLRPFIRETESMLQELTARREQLPPLAPGRHGESLGFHSRFQENIEDQLDVRIDLGSERTFDRIALFPVSTVFQGATIAGYGFPRHFRIDVSLDPDFQDAIPVYQFNDPDIQTRPEYPVQVFISELSARYLRLRVLQHWERSDGRILTALGEVMVLSDGRNVAIGGTVQADSFASLPAWSSANLIDGQTDLGLPVKPEASPSNGYLSGPALTPEELKWVQLELPRMAQIDEIRLFPTQPLDAPSQYGHGFPRRFRVLASMNPNLSPARTIGDYSTVAFPNPGDNPVIIPGDGKPARFIRVEAEELWHITNQVFSLALSEMQVFEDRHNLAREAEVSFLDIGATNAPFYKLWNPAYLVDGFSSQNRLIELDEWLDGLEERKTLDQKIRQLEIENRQATETTILGILLVGTGLVGTLLTLIVFTIIRRRRLVLRKQRELRNRISRDLHDDLGSRVGGMRLISENLLHDPDLPASLREDIYMIYRASGEANDAMGDIVWLLDTSESSRAKMVDHMRQLMPSVLGRLEHQFRVGKVPEQDLDFDFRRQILFSFRECLGNVTKHAEAHRVICHVGGDEKRFTFEVRDDGKGFDLEKADYGHGLENLRTRAVSIGGSVEIHSSPGRGTRVILDTPVRQRR